jgi:serine/threonine protein phosphatase 1
MTPVLFKFFPQNRHGRDFVVGDIHGCFFLLEALLESVQFQPECDRVFSVGDLVDRGDESKRAAEFIRQPWFQSIMGNHERMLLDSKTDPLTRHNWVQYNGGDWWEETTLEEQVELQLLLRTLPLAFEIATAQGRVGIVHADVPENLSWKAFIQALQDDKQVREHALWSRKRYQDVYTTGKTSVVEGIDWLVCGHTPLRRPLQAGNIHYIDTGAVFWGEPGMGKLTLLQIHPQQEVFQMDIGDLTSPH